MISLWLEKGVSGLKRSCVIVCAVCSYTVTKHQKEDIHARTVSEGKKKKKEDKDNKAKKDGKVQAYMAIDVFMGAAVASGSSSPQGRRFRCQTRMDFSLQFLLFPALG